MIQWTQHGQRINSPGTQAETFCQHGAWLHTVRQPSATNHCLPSSHAGAVTVIKFMYQCFWSFTMIFSNQRSLIELSLFRRPPWSAFPGMFSTTVVCWADQLFLMSLQDLLQPYHLSRHKGSISVRVATNVILTDGDKSFLGDSMQVARPAIDVGSSGSRVVVKHRQAKKKSLLVHLYRPLAIPWVGKPSPSLVLDLRSNTGCRGRRTVEALKQPCS